LKLACSSENRKPCRNKPIQIGITLASKKKSVKRKRKPESAPTENLLDQLAKLTGLSTPDLKKELKTILEKKNLDPKKLTLEQLRQVLASYVREIMIGILDRTSNRQGPNQTH
jgi:hypothetical protein